MSQYMPQYMPQYTPQYPQYYVQSLYNTQATYPQMHPQSQPHTPTTLSQNSQNILNYNQNILTYQNNISQIIFNYQNNILLYQNNMYNFVNQMSNNNYLMDTSHLQPVAVVAPDINSANLNNTPEPPVQPQQPQQQDQNIFDSEEYNYIYRTLFDSAPRNRRQPDNNNLAFQIPMTIFNNESRPPNTPIEPNDINTTNVLNNNTEDRQHIAIISRSYILNDQSQSLLPQSLLNIPAESPIQRGLTQTEIENYTELLLYSTNMPDSYCPITLEQFQIDEQISKIRGCNHIFKTRPLLNWFRLRNSCPVCRFNLLNTPVPQRRPQTQHENETMQETMQNNINDNNTISEYILPINSINVNDIYIIRTDDDSEDNDDESNDDETNGIIISNDDDDDDADNDDNNYE